ncbi:MAG: hypothetical protein ACRCYQ_13055 [Nocardioides sp.]
MTLSDHYTATALGQLRHYLDDDRYADDDHAGLQQQEQAQHLAEEAHEYAQKLIADHELSVESWQRTEEADEFGDPVNPPPDMLTDELEYVSRQIRELERYRKALMAFAARYALDDYSQRDLAQIAGVNHATISRWLTDTTIEDKVRAEIQPLAATMAKQVDVNTLLTDPHGAHTADVLARLIRAASPHHARTAVDHSREASDGTEETSGVR